MEKFKRKIVLNEVSSSLRNLNTNIPFIYLCMYTYNVHMCE